MKDEARGLRIRPEPAIESRTAQALRSIPLAVGAGDRTRREDYFRTAKTIDRLNSAGGGPLPEQSEAIGGTGAIDSASAADHHHRSGVAGGRRVEVSKLDHAIHGVPTPELPG